MEISSKVNFAALIVVIAVNALANIIPLGGVTTGQVSANYDIMLTPAPLTFSIWGVIYTLLVATFIIELFRPEQGKKESKIFGIYFMLSCIGNIAWILCWHLLPVQISFFVILVILFSLYEISRNITAAGSKPGRVCRITFSVYFGWITVATLVNFCVFCYSLGAVDAFSKNSIVTVVFIVIAAVLALYFSLYKKLPFYAYTVSWALLGIFIKQQGINMLPAVTAITSCAVVAGAALAGQIKRHRLV